MTIREKTGKIWRGFINIILWLPSKLLKSVFQPTLVGKLRWTFAAIVMLFLMAGLIDAPGYYNRLAGGINGRLSQTGFLSAVKLPTMSDWPFHLGLDLQGGAHLVYEADTSVVASGERDDALSGVRDVIERRVNALGVAEPLVQINRQENHDRVIVELAGVQDVNEAISQIGETPLLEFKTAPPPLTSEELESLQKLNDEAKATADRLTSEVLAGADFVALARDNSADTGSKDRGGDLDFFKREVMVSEFAEAVFDRLKVGETTTEPVKSQFGWHIIKKTEERGEGDNQEARASHILVRTYTENDVRASSENLDQYGFVRSELTGEHLKRSQLSFDPQTNEPIVNLEFNDDGAKLFENLTRDNLNKVVAIYLDGQPISVPQVNQIIAGGQAVITGNFTLDEAKTLSQRLNAGALPIPIDLVSQQTVGPTLGAASVAASLKAALFGLALVIIFMLLVYRLPGLLAVLALAVYGVVTLAIFKLIPVTLTLAGIAGFILSLGMAVDANVLIFARLKEELKAGRSLSSAIDEAFKRAWSSIRDGNLSTLITCFILATFTTSIIKGFAITLAIGVLVSMFSAIVVTRNFLKLIARTRLAKINWLFGLTRH